MYKQQQDLLEKQKGITEDQQKLLDAIERTHGESSEFIKTQQAFMKDQQGVINTLAKELKKLVSINNQAIIENQSFNTDRRNEDRTGNSFAFATGVTIVGISLLAASGTPSEVILVAFSLGTVFMGFTQITGKVFYKQVRSFYNATLGKCFKWISSCCCKKPEPTAENIIKLINSKVNVTLEDLFETFPSLAESMKKLNEEQPGYSPIERMNVIYQYLKKQEELAAHLSKHLDPLKHSGSSSNPPATQSPSSLLDRNVAVDVKDALKPSTIQPSNSSTIIERFSSPLSSHASANSNQSRSNHEGRRISNQVNITIISPKDTNQVAGMPGFSQPDQALPPGVVNSTASNEHGLHFIAPNIEKRRQSQIPTTTSGIKPSAENGKSNEKTTKHRNV